MRRQRTRRNLTALQHNRKPHNLSGAVLHGLTYYLEHTTNMKLTTILLGLTIAFSTSALHAAPTAKQILKSYGAGETSCGDDERGTVTELKLITGAEVNKLMPWAEAAPKAKYLQVISTLTPQAAKDFGQPTMFMAVEVDANAKLEEFKPLLGIPSCHMMGD